jgi:hypothetical protein
MVWVLLPRTSVSFSYSCSAWMIRVLDAFYQIAGLAFDDLRELRFFTKDQYPNPEWFDVLSPVDVHYFLHEINKQYTVLSSKKCIKLSLSYSFML